MYCIFCHLCKILKKTHHKCGRYKFYRIFKSRPSHSSRLSILILQSYNLLCFQRPTFEVAELPAPMSPMTAGQPTEASSSFNFNNLPPLNTRRQSENPSNFRHPAPAPLSSASFSARRHSEFPSSQPQLSSTSFRNLPPISTRGNSNMTGEPPSTRNLFTVG